MRNAFAEEITALAARDPRIVLLSGDMGNRLFDRFKGEFPDRFYNVGVAEANMIGIAAGLARDGFRPVTYTIAAFGIYRCYEQIRIDLGYQQLPVIMVGTGSGLAYAANGPTHHSCEDMAILRVIPGRTVAAPADAGELRGLLRDALQLPGPTYLRIGKKGEPTVYDGIPDVRLGTASMIRPGATIAVLCAGTLLPEALLAAEGLQTQGLSVEVQSFHTIKPLDEQQLQRVFSSFSLVVTIEEHSRLAGLGGAIAEWVADQVPRPRAQLLRLGVPDRFLHEAGEQEHAREVFGLTGPHLAESIARSWQTLAGAS